MDWGQGYASAGNDIGAGIALAMDQYHKEHQAYDQQVQLADALGRIGINKEGKMVPFLDAEGKKVSDVSPIIDQKTKELFLRGTEKNRAKATGALEALNHIGLANLRGQMSQGISDAGLSGQRTQQIIQQNAQSFPLEQQNLEARTAHLKKITDEEGKIPVPGFGLMTPSQFSAHTARMERMDVLKKKSEPILTFENQLQTRYGLGIQDVADAAKQYSSKSESDHTPFYDATGTPVSLKTARANQEGTFLKIGPNGVPVPLFDKKGGLGWSQIMGKAKQFSGKLEGLQKDQADLQNQASQHQAQMVIDVVGKKDPSQLTPEDQAALAKAKAILGQ